MCCISPAPAVRLSNGLDRNSLSYQVNVCASCSWMKYTWQVPRARLTSKFGLYSMCKWSVWYSSSGCSSVDQYNQLVIGHYGSNQYSPCGSVEVEMCLAQPSQGHIYSEHFVKISLASICLVSFSKHSSISHGDLGLIFPTDFTRSSAWVRNEHRRCGNPPGARWLMQRAQGQSFNSKLKWNSKLAALPLKLKRNTKSNGLVVTLKWKPSVWG